MHKLKAYQQHQWPRHDKTKQLQLSEERRQENPFRQCVLPCNSVSRAQSNSMQTTMRPAATPTWRSGRQGPAPCTCQFKPRSTGHVLPTRSPARHTESSWNCLHPQKQHHVLATVRAAPHAASNEPQTFTEDDVIDVGAEEVDKAPLIPVTVSSGSIFAQCSAVWYDLHPVWPAPFGREVSEGLLNSLQILGKPAHFADG